MRHGPSLGCDLFAPRPELALVALRAVDDGLGRPSSSVVSCACQPRSFSCETRPHSTHWSRFV